MERLFGRGKSKKSSTQNTPIVSNEDEGSGFAVVSNTPPPTGQQAAAATSIYPSVNSSPYPVLNPSVATSSSPMNQGSNDQQSSTTPTVERNNSVVGAYLDGIPFSLSTKCIGDSNVDEVTARIERLAERIRCVDWNSTEYDFRLEKSVVNEDVNSSLMRMNVGFP